MLRLLIGLLLMFLADAHTPFYIVLLCFLSLSGVGHLLYKLRCCEFLQS